MNNSAVSKEKMELMIHLHEYMIETIARGEPLGQVLKSFSQKIEAFFEHKTYCSLLSVTESNRLAVKEASNLPLEFQQAVHLAEIEIGPQACSCGTAAYRKKPVIVSDIENDPLWELFADEALRFGLKACWSIPILIDERVVGTFAVYHTQVYEPAPYEINLLKTCANLTGLAIERDQRIKLGQELQESKQRFQSLFDYYPYSIYVFSLEGRFLGFNQEAQPLSGYSKDELLNTSFVPLIAPEDLEKVLFHFNQATQGIVQHYECQIIHREGKRFTIRLTNIPIRVNEKIVGVYGIARDITSEKQMEQDLHATHREIAHLFENHQGALFKFKKINNEFIHTFGGGQLLEKWGLKPSDWTGKPLKDFIPLEMAEWKTGYYEQAWNGKETGYEGEINGVHYLAEMKPIWQDGKVIEVIVSCMDITELKKVHEELRETKELLHSFANHTADAILTQNAKGEISYVNQAYIDLFGWEKADLIGRPILNVPQKHQSEFSRLFQLTFSEKKVNRFEAEWETKDGRSVPVSITQSPLKDQTGSVNGASAIIRDVTEQKRIEKEAKENRQRYQSLFYANPDMVYSLDTNGVLIDINLSAFRLLGHIPEKVIRMHWEKFVSPASLKQAKVCFEKAMNGVAQTFEAVLVHQNGTHIPFQITNMPIFVNNQIVGVHGIAKDITERKQSQQDVLRLKQQLELVLDSVGDGIYVMDKTLNIKLVNPAGAKMLGYEVHELIGKSPKETFCGSSGAGAGRMYQPFVDGTIQSVSDEFFCKKDGTSIPVDYVASPILESNSIMGIVVIFRDISEKKMSEEYFLKSAKLETAGQLAAGVAHEIRNPLTAIQGFIQLMEETNQNEPEYFAIIRSEFERIEGIISEFLALAKPQAINFQPEDIRLLLYQTIHLMNAQASMKGIEILPDIEPGLPFVQCDKHQLKQVFINIIKNAIEATVSKGHLQITARATASHLHIVFQDQGAGIPQERIERLFEPFYSTKEKGTGLGLMISYKIVEEHKGVMRIESEEGTGTAVHILLPLSDPLHFPDNSPYKISK